MVLEDKGAWTFAIKARGVASASRLSTMVVYSHFGGMAELIRAVVDQGFKELDRAFSRCR
jgi:AcrR family transcriptional regulator